MTTTIPLTRSTRDTVTTLTRAKQEADEASQRLSTGKSVNSALDDPSSYFMAQALDSRAAELDRTVEQLGQGIQVISAANDGMEAISKLMTQANAVAKQAGESSDAFDRAEFAASYNKLLVQIAGIAKDSGYKGKNLLLGEGHDLKLYLGDKAEDAIVVSSSDFTNVEQTLGLAPLKTGTIAAKTISLGAPSDNVGMETKLLDTAGGFSDGDTIEVTSTDPVTGTSTVVSSLAIDGDTKVSDLLQTLNQANSGIRARLEPTTGSLVVEGASSKLAVSGGPFDGTAFDATESSWFAAGGVAATQDKLVGANVAVREHAAAIGTNLTMLQNRQTFMKTFSGTLQSSSSALVSADSSEEGARLIALQTRQQLATSSLTITRTADEGVLRLISG